MATQQFTVEDDRYQQEPPAGGRNWLKGCLIGCLVVVVLLLVVGVVATIWVYRNFKSLATTVAAEGIKQGIDASDLPAEEKVQVKVEVDRGINLFREGRMSGEQAAMLFEKLMNSPLMTAMVMTTVENKYLDKSGLIDEEKAEARITLPRFVRGMIDEKIDVQSQNAAMQHVGERQPNNQWQLRENISDEDLRAFLAEAKKAADESQIPEQPNSVDASDEVKRIIDETMAAPAMAPTPEVPPLDVPPPAEKAPTPEAKNEPPNET